MTATHKGVLVGAVAAGAGTEVVKRLPVVGQFLGRWGALGVAVMLWVMAKQASPATRESLYDAAVGALGVWLAAKSQVLMGEAGVGALVGDGFLDSLPGGDPQLALAAPRSREPRRPYIAALES